MGTKVRKRRSTSDISKLSAQTRLTAWTIYMESVRSGMDPTVALQKALQDACPPKDDPYYRSFYPNKTRELELWRKHALWPLSKPKDIEHDTGPHDTVEIATEVLGRVLGNGEGSSSFTLLLDAERPDDEDRIDTLEFDPVEVAKIIDSYECESTLFSAETSEPAETALRLDAGYEFIQSLYEDLPFSTESLTIDQDSAPSQTETASQGTPQERCAHSQPGISVSANYPAGPLQAVGHDLVGRVELDQDTLNELLEMLAWWKGNKEHLADPETPAALRPHFTHSHLKTKRITMNAKLWEDAEKVAKGQAQISGGTLSGLVEYLLWRHLGSQEEYTETP